MDYFNYRHGELYAEDIAVKEIANEVGTPCYIYSQKTLERHARVFKEALCGLDNPILAFAIKANPNLAVLRVLANQGYGADVVSGGELKRALAAGIPASKIVFSGVGKDADELHLGLMQNIGQFNIESESEGEMLAQIAKGAGRNAPGALRINPDIDAGTHAKISTGLKENKFGVPISDALAIFDRLSAMDGLNMRGIAMHIGSQLSDLTPLARALEKMDTLLRTLRQAGHSIDIVDLGGGIGVPYRKGEIFPSPQEYGEMVSRLTKGWDVQLMFEPGRVIAGNSGIMVTKVIRLKPGIGKDFVIVDGAMNDLMRPALYDAWHDIDAVQPSGKMMLATVAGPICESSDIFAEAREIDAVKAGDLISVRTAGAYGATMANTYNSRPLVPEVLVNGRYYAIVAERIQPETIMAAEKLPEWLKEGK